jgi:hypothetical protein
VFELLHNKQEREEPKRMGQRDSGWEGKPHWMPVY